MVADSDAGYATDDRENMLPVGVKSPLRALAREGRICRKKVAGRFVYFCTDTSARKQQLRARQVWAARPRG